MFFDDFKPDEFVFIPLGGSEQFGVNLNVYGYQGKWLAIDCGLGFADDHFPGVDILLPDPAFLEERRKDIVGLVITHAHEDHIGALPYLWSRLKCPIYCTRFSAAVLRQKMSEAEDAKGMVIHEISADNKVKLDPFTLTFVGMCHSIPDAVGVAIETDVGRVIHSGDWNDDQTPVLGQRTNREALKAMGRDGVLAYIGDSTNSDKPGHTRSEVEVEKGLEDEFKTCDGKIVVTVFASNIARIQSICRAARASGRHVGLVGRSLHRMYAAARESGFLKNIPDPISEADLARLPDRKQVLIATGSQGEPRAALARIARNDFEGVTVGRGDTVIFSSFAIPGNETKINQVQNNLLLRNVRVVTARSTPNFIHTSGHPCRADVADMMDWVKPRIVVPVHGERIQLEAQASLAREKEVPFVIIPENGSVIKLHPEHPEVLGKVEARVLAVEPSRIVADDHSGLSERRKLQVSGALHITAAVTRKGRLVAPLQISGIGLFDHGDPEDVQLLRDLEDELQTRVEDLQDEAQAGDMNFLSEELRIGARRVVNAALGFKPKTTVHIVLIPG